MAIQVAVSILSPVSIQILIPAFLNSSIVPLTSSCNLSSTPVTPSNSRSFSKYSAITLAIASFLSPSETLASRYPSSKAFHDSSLSLLRAMTSVRNPSLAMLPHSSSSQSLYATILAMTTSAPFWKKVMSPVCRSRITIPIRFDSEVKGKTSRMSNERTWPAVVRRDMVVRSRAERVRPTDSVQRTMATSSGEEAW